jgi:membrane-associated PAP2 superfamily phosphatase
MGFIQKHKRWLYPTFLLLLITPFTPWLDLSIENHFYEQGNDPVTHFVNSPFNNFVYNYLSYLAFAAVGIAGLAFLISFIRNPHWRNHSLAIMLTMIIGAGLIVHVVLKEYWGRPRPRQIENYGGNQVYHPVWKPQLNPPEPSKSFTCGHCTMGFFFFALYFVGLRTGNRYLKWGGLAAAIILGAMLGWARMAQGGHFFSDVIYSAYFMWIAALMMDWLVYSKEEVEAAH